VFTSSDHKLQSTSTVFNMATVTIINSSTFPIHVYIGDVFTFAQMISIGNRDSQGNLIYDPATGKPLPEDYKQTNKTKIADISWEAIKQAADKDLVLKYFLDNFLSEDQGQKAQSSQQDASKSQAQQAAKNGSPAPKS